MPLFTAAQLPQVRAIASLGETNPFGPERIRLEKQLLGPEYQPEHPTWVITPTQQGFAPNLNRLAAEAETYATHANRQLARGYQPTVDEWRLYGGLCLYTLYYRCETPLYNVILDEHGNRQHMPFYKRFLSDWHDLFGHTPLASDPHFAPQHMFAVFFQIRRAFHFIFRTILGASAAASALRVNVWQSVFGNDMHRYQRSLYRRMHEIPTLIIGESGTGKELVASAIGMSRYIPFDSHSLRFESDYRSNFQPVHLAALPLTLLESELFGHRKGAFTGAIADRAGYLETRHSAETVFLDEVGELPAEVQVKLLRVLQTRQFLRLGDNQPRTFHGKIVSATHRDLAAGIQSGAFRADLYYRLCSDQIRTPSLSEQIRNHPEELQLLVTLVAAKVVDADIAVEIAEETGDWIRQHLPEHPWPGNMRELEQCVRSMLIRGHYYPATRDSVSHGLREDFGHDIAAGRLDNAALLGRYYALIYADCGSYEAAAQKLGTDWRTVKSNMDREFLEQLRVGKHD